MNTINSIDPVQYGNSKPLTSKEEVAISKLPRPVVFNPKWVKKNGQPKACFTSPQQVCEYLKAFQCEYEALICIYLDMSNAVIDCRIENIGMVDQCMVCHSRIWREALIMNASSIVISHNHPTGIIKPSAVDRTITVSMIKQAKILNMRFLDHIVIGNDNQTYSFKLEESELWPQNSM